MHNLKHRAILGTLWRLARKRAQCEPSESENKTNDGNGCNYIYGRVLIWLAKSLPFPSLSPAYLLLAHFERQPLDLPLPPFSIYHSVKFSLLVFFTICSSAQAAEGEVASVPPTSAATVTKSQSDKWHLSAVIRHRVAHFQMVHFDPSLPVWELALKTTHLKGFLFNYMDTVKILIGEVPHLPEQK